MADRELLFMLGDMAAADVVAERFVPAAGGIDAVMALLLQGGPEWERYVPRYVDPWLARGVTRYHAIAPDEDGSLDVEAACARLKEATGIFIGGGHTPTYHRLYAQGQVGETIHHRYRNGVPVAGVSAGAMISLESCVLTPDETEDGSFRMVPGLGLAKDIVVEVHFTEQNRLAELLEAMVVTRTHRALGIDEAACAVFENGQFAGRLGRSVYEVTMEDFASRTYASVECSRPYVAP